MLRGLTGAPGVGRAGHRRVRRLHRVRRPVIADRRENPRDDLMSVLVHAEVDGDRLDHDSLVHESLLILIGGDETTRHVISGGAFQLLRRPRSVGAAGGPTRPDLPPAVEEMLRWVSPIKNMARTVTRDVELEASSSRPARSCCCSTRSANRDEDVFDDPFRFDIARTPERARGVRLRHPLLPRQQPGPPRAAG